MKTPIGSTLKSARIETGLSVREIAAKLTAAGHPTAEKTVYGWENGARQPDVETFLVLCDLLHIDGFTRFSVSRPHTADLAAAEHARLLYKIRELDAHGKEAVNAVLNVELARVQSAKNDAVTEKVQTLVLQKFTAPVSAGSGTVLDSMDGCEPLCALSNAYTRRADYVLQVRGKSMEPRFHNDDLILVEECDDVAFGEIGIWYLDGRSYVKQKGEGRLISLNKAYPDIALEDYLDMRCQGRVVGILDPDWVCS